MILMYVPIVDFPCSSSRLLVETHIDKIATVRYGAGIGRYGTYPISHFPCSSSRLQVEILVSGTIVICEVRYGVSLVPYRYLVFRLRIR
jgi:hypothetical protein